MKKLLFYCKNISAIRYSIIFVFAFLLSFALTAKANAVGINLPSCPTTRESSEAAPVAIRIKSISSDQSMMQIQCYQDGNLSIKPIKVEDQELQAILKSFKKDDQVILKLSQDNKLQSLSIATHEVAWIARIATLIIVLLVLLFIFWLLLKGSLWKLIVGEDNRFSNSKTQIALWFFILIITYIASIVLRFIYGGINFVGGVSIPQNLLALSGLSAFTYAAAKGITQSRLDDPEMQRIKDPDKNIPKFPDDLFRDDKGRVDLGDFQMITVALIAVIVYLAETLGFLGTIELYKTVTLPDVDTTILSTFGLGQGAYLVKKFFDDGGK
jgi:biopolymer transport protein ExbD